MGAGGVVLRYDGTAWTGVSGVTPAELHGVWASSSSDVFAAGIDRSQDVYRGVIMHFDGYSWSTVWDAPNVWLSAVWGFSPSNVFVVGYDFGYNPYHAVILHYDGAAWTETTGLAPAELYAVWGSSPTDVFAVGDSDENGGVILHYDGTTWSPMAGETPDALLNGVWGVSSSSAGAPATLWRRYGITTASRGRSKRPGSGMRVSAVFGELPRRMFSPSAG